MTHSELKELLSRFSDFAILVVGDFFLDRYLMVDPDLAEISLETGLEARQVVDVRNRPGAAGTVTSNLNALGVGRIHALGAIGDDGQGYDLKAGLHASGVDTRDLMEVSGRVTPTYTKPVLSATGKEMERLDIKNRSPLPRHVEDRILATLESLLGEVHGVILLDQVQEPNCGVITDRVRDGIARLATEYPHVFFLADSRSHIGLFRNVTIKVNREEAFEAVSRYSGTEGTASLSRAIRSMVTRTGRPVYVTLGPDGILCDDGEATHHVPGIPVPDPIDIVGAGDSVSAGIVSALCASASYVDAARVGVLVSSITIQQIGTTGTASPEQVLQRFEESWQDS
ncbi:MAG: PfkB family carbohydrate kinase [Gemmatimonadetes bacterium]|nr:PfkB family carbohydrate kinase [Gemmatimonadota bacterium]